jgi:RNA polymerase sigma factor (sigma-70 family)
MARIAKPTDKAHLAPAGNNESDCETIRRAKAYLHARANGNAPDTELLEAWERLFSLYDPLIRRLACRRCRQYADRQDARQEIWCAIVAHLDQFEPNRGAFQAWLKALIWNRIVSRGREGGRVQRTGRGLEGIVPARNPHADGVCELAETREQVAAAMAELRDQISPMNYAIFHDHWLEARDFSEIAVTLSLNVKQVRDHHHRAMVRFREILAALPINDRALPLSARQQVRAPVQGTNQ